MATELHMSKHGSPCKVGSWSHPHLGDFTVPGSFSDFVTLFSRGKAGERLFKPRRSPRSEELFRLGGEERFRQGPTGLSRTNQERGSRGFGTKPACKDSGLSGPPGLTPGLSHTAQSAAFDLLSGCAPWGHCLQRFRDPTAKS